MYNPKQLPKEKGFFETLGGMLFGEEKTAQPSQKPATLQPIPPVQAATPPLANPANAQTNQEDWLAQPYNPDFLIPRIRMVESSGDPRAFNKEENAIGHLQIRPDVITDVNEWNRMRGIPMTYTHQDALDPHKAMQIFRSYIDRYGNERRLGRKPTNMDAARIWNGGPDGYRTTGLKQKKLNRLDEYTGKVRASQPHELNKEEKKGK